MLFPIELEGAGTCDVESLASYVYRVAYEHGIFVGELLRHINKQTSALTHLDTEAQPVPAFLKPAEMVRNNRSSAAIQGALEKLTGLELSQSRLLFMTSDIGRSPNEVAPGFRWCPECMGVAGPGSATLLQANLASVSYYSLPESSHGADIPMCILQL